MPNLSGQMKRKLTTAQETGASNWLSALPIRAKGFSLNKQEFTDALALRYGWIVKDSQKFVHVGKILMNVMQCLVKKEVLYPSDTMR